MENLFSTEALWSLIPLTLMEILLGIDNVIFVSIVLSRLDRSQVKGASLIWMITGIAMRLFFLFVLGYLLKGVHVLLTIFEHPDLHLPVYYEFREWNSLIRTSHRLTLSGLLTQPDVQK